MVQIFFFWQWKACLISIDIAAWIQSGAWEKTWQGKVIEFLAKQWATKLALLLTKLTEKEGLRTNIFLHWLYGSIEKSK